MTSMGEDEEAEIEKEIRRELDALGEDNLEVCDIEDEDSPTQPQLNEDDALPDTVKEFLKIVHSRNTLAEDELKECDHVLSEVPDIGYIYYNDKNVASKIQETLGNDVEGDPLELRNKVLAELEEDDIKDEKEKLRADATEEILALDIIRPDIMEEIRAQEAAAQERLFRWEEEHRKREETRQNLLAERKRDEELRKEREQQLREKKQKELEEERKRVDIQQQAMAARLKQVLKEEEKQMAVLHTQLQEEIQILELEKRKESETLLKMKEEEAKNISERINNAATKIQKHFRRMRVQKHYKPILDSKREERFRKRKEELDTIERVETKVRENAETRRIEEEAKRKREIEERKLREEEERKLKEEQKRIKEEKKRREAEELKRKEEDQRKEEEERKRKEAEELKRKEEEQRKVEEERKKRELEEMKRREEEQKMIEEEKKKEAAELKRKEEEMKRKALMEEKIKKEQEEKKKREEEIKKRLDEEARKKMEEERRKLEEEKLVLDKEKRRVEEDEKAKRKEVEERMRREMEDKRRKDLEEEINRIKDNSVQQESSQGICSGLEDDIEKKRLQWIEQNQPWSSIPSKKVKPDITSRSKPRRLLSASRHPQLTVDEIIQASPPGTSVHQVTQVVLKDLRSCNLQGLQQCPSVKFLSMENCGVVALSGLNNCKELSEIHFPNNKIELINDVHLSSLESLNMESNHLTSIHGLENCTNLRLLNLKNNKITRLAGLQGCPLLQNLVLDNNQLIMVKGLVSLRSLQSLSCIDNHLTRVTDLEDCGLLQTLNLQGNNLHEAPSLMNHVLLRELFLDDNSISNLEPLSTAWLPLLQYLSVSQNSLSCLTPLKSLIMLQKLDISNNVISDLDSLLTGLHGCESLQILRLEGNPVNEEPECRSKVLEVAPFLTCIDGVDMPIKECKDRNTKPLSRYVSMCSHQISEKDLLEKTHKNDLKNFDTEKDQSCALKRLHLKSKQFQELHDMVVKHRQQHESFGYVENTKGSQNTIETKTRAESTVYASVSLCDERNIQYDDKVQYNAGSKENLQKHNQISPLEKLPSRTTISDPNAAATKIQALWRGWYLRHQIDVQTTRWLAAVTIQSTWRGFSTWKKYQPIRRMKQIESKHPPWQQYHHRAATLIQATYRGYSVRRRLQVALASAHFHHSIDDDFNYDEEVDLTAFDFDESMLDSGWTPAETPVLPSRHPVLPTPPQQQKMPQDYISEDMAGNIPWRTRHAWRSADSPITDAKPPLPHKPKASPDHDHMSITSAGASSKQEELSTEWGFRNTATAELMMKRAKRMKKKTKPKNADSRFALFKKLDEVNKPLRDVTKVTASTKKPPPRVDYFAAKEFLSSASSPSPDSKAQMTYSWVYNQAVVHQDEQDNLMSGRKDFTCEESPSPPKRPPQGKTKSGSPPVTLPQMDYVMLSGRPVPLVTSPVNDYSDQNARRVSYDERRQDTRLYFPPIRSPSVPNLVNQDSSPVPEQPREKEKSNSAGARISKDRKGRR